MQGSYLENKFTDDEIKRKFYEMGANFEIFKDDELIEKTAIEISKGNAIGWFQGNGIWPSSIGK